MSARCGRHRLKTLHRGLQAGALALGFLGLAGLGGLAPGSAIAGVSASSRGLCHAREPQSAALQDRRLRLVARIRAELQASGREAALIWRAGLDLARFGQRYSHAGVSLRESANTPWSVRQLYYACSEERPRVFDQGLAGFMLGADEQVQARVTLLLLPAQASAALAAAALDDRQALALLGEDYSANAYAFSTRYQNCNQWVAELLAAAWGPAQGSVGATTREQAQAWLQQRGYEPHRFEGPPWLYLASLFVPLLHQRDHPEEDRAAARYRVSMPSSLEAFVRAQLPGTERIEFCQDDTRITVRRGWQPLGESCEPGPGDESVLLGEALRGAERKNAQDPLAIAS